MGTVGGKCDKAEELQDILGGLKRLSKEEQRRRWGQREKQGQENVELVKTSHQIGCAFGFLLT